MARRVPERFRVAFSLAGEHRDLVRLIAAELENMLGESTVFYDEWYEYYLAGSDADLRLQRIFTSGSDLVVLCVSGEYGRRPWASAEYEAVRSRYMESLSDVERLGILAIRVGDGELPGIFLSTVMPDARMRSPAETARLIEDRLSLVSEPPPPPLEVSNGLETRTDVEAVAQADRTARAARVGPEPEPLELKVIRLLLSSPGDCLPDRDAYERSVSRLNQELTPDTGRFVQLIRWESLAPQIGPGPQAVVNRQIGEYDILTGIMWNRFGTPTDNAGSGTEEEFNDAFSSWSDQGSPWINFYFCDRPATLTTEDELDQRSLVLKFRRRMEAMGIVRTYDDLGTFEEQAYRDLRRVVHASIAGGGHN